MKIIALVALLLLVGCVSAPQQQTSEQLSVTVIVNDGHSPVTKQITLANGSTAFEAFSKAAQLNYSVHPVYGTFITGVNGVEQNGTHFWQYYVDGELAPVGVDAFRITKDSTLEFRLEQPPAEWA
jgi:hypothetical protein